MAGMESMYQRGRFLLLLSLAGKTGLRCFYASYPHFYGARPYFQYPHRRNTDLPRGAQAFTTLDTTSHRFSFGSHCHWSYPWVLLLSSAIAVVTVHKADFGATCMGQSKKIRSVHHLSISSSRSVSFLGIFLPSVTLRGFHPGSSG